ncbi:MAG: beta-propeller fold lactonase family protein [Leptolyngbyaceae cyanobacterium bins.302]|nr:beta-propeller fold lactonase family protein [Leptolyngbyaceae cyanobacterium bins.302]
MVETQGTIPPGATRREQLRAGQQLVIALADKGTPTMQAQHRVIETATTDIAPEGLTISPDGTLVVTVNMRGSLFPQGSSRFTRESSLSLLTLDRQSGKLTKIDDYPFEGILPESAVFDVKGNYLAVAVYDYFTSKPEGAVEFWQVVRKPAPTLKPMNQRIDVGRGAHQVVVAP